MMDVMIARTLNAETGVMKDIMEFEKDIVIKAGAGTGKTTALVSKYISELTKKREDGYIKVDQLLAITFTDKAAAEMKLRVREKLKELIEQLQSLAGIKGSSANMAEDEPGWKEREKLLAHLIRQRQGLEGAYISTIHSFCARLLRENPVTAGVDPNFSVMQQMEAEALMESVAGKTILQKLREGDKGVRTLVVNEGFESFGKIKPGLKTRVATLIPFLRAADRSPVVIEKDFNERLKMLKAGVAPAQIELEALVPKMKSQNKNSSVYKLAGMIEENEHVYFESDITIDQSRELLRLSKWVKPKNTSSNEGLKKIAASASGLLMAIGGAALEQEMRWVTRSFIALMDETLRQYSDEKNYSSSLDYDDLQEKARDLLKRNKSVRELYKNRFIKTLVDEFQDINELQYGIIRLLAEPGEGKLFIVGDVKQSIYGFRGAQVGVFERVGSEIQSGGGKEFTLRTNRRSAPALIDFFNKTFQFLMSHEMGSVLKFDSDRDGLMAHRSADGIDSAVIRKTCDSNEAIGDLRLREAWGVAGSLRGEIESGKIIVEGDEGLRPLEYRDVALLLRKFVNVSLYENALRLMKIPVRVVRGRGFYHSQEVMDFISLLSFLDYSGDELALASILRSPLVGVDDNTLIRLFRDGEGRLLSPVSSIIGDGPLPRGIENGDKEKIELFKTRVTRWKKSRDRMFISELIETALAETGYGAVMISRNQGNQKLANLFKLIEMARAYESDGSRGLKNFVSLLKKMIDQTPTEAQADMTGGDENVVRLMTTHQSKGLEFPVVILGDMAAEPSRRANAIEFHPEKGLGMKHMDTTTGEKIAGPIYTDVMTARNEDETEELKRLLYVGVTRARDRLILSGSQTKGKGVWHKWIDEAIEGGGLEVESQGYGQFQTIADMDRIKENPKQVKLILDEVAPATHTPVEKPKRRFEFMLSVTGLATLHHCARLYYYQNVMELGVVSPEKALDVKGKKQAGAALLGARVHMALEKMPIGIGSQAGERDRIMEAALAGLPDSARKKVVADISRAFKKPPLKALAQIYREDIHRETPVILKIVDKDFSLILTGQADLLWRDGEMIKLVDYKYSEAPWERARYDFQIKVYAYALLVAGKAKTVEVSIVYLREKKKPVVSKIFSQSDLPEMKQSIVNVARDLSRLNGQLEREWRLNERSFCDKLHCFFKNKCFPVS